MKKIGVIYARNGIPPTPQFDPGMVVTVTHTQLESLTDAAEYACVTAAMISVVRPAGLPLTPWPNLNLTGWKSKRVSR